MGKMCEYNYMLYLGSLLHLVRCENICIFEILAICL
jgi:hypothetical protein